MAQVLLSKKILAVLLACSNKKPNFILSCNCIASFWCVQMQNNYRLQSVEVVGGVSAHMR